MQKSIYITEEQYQKLISMALMNEDFNYHYTHGQEHNGKPYYSDNKFMMAGRDTGHFGSGTYFSTYKFDSNRDIEQYNAERTDEPQFIRIRDNVYRVDLGFYKNLYKVPNQEWGNVLYTTLERVNQLYNMVANGNYNCAAHYQIIRNNSNHLGLKCPSYYQLMKMALEHAKHDDDIRSFSTVFMEYNGYNGVNVSGIYGLDNTLHGSVVYDLSQVEGNMGELPKGDIDGYKYRLYLGDAHHAIVYDDENDYQMMALDGKGENQWIEVVLNGNANVAKRLLKNYTNSGNLINGRYLEHMNPSLLKWYLLLLYHTSNQNIGYEVASDGKYLNAIVKVSAWQWLNYDGTWYGRKSLFVQLMKQYYNELDWNLDDETIRQEMTKYAQFLIGHMGRNLNEIEMNYLQKMKIEL